MRDGDLGENCRVDDGEATRRDALVERLFVAAVGTMDLYGVFLGDRLGLYRALADGGPLTSGELAARAGIHERYAREWLEQQAAGSIVDVDDAGVGPLERRYSLPSGHEEALLDRSSLNYAAPFGRFIVACARPIDALLEAFRTGAGVPYEQYGVDLYEGQAAFTRPLFENLLGAEWFPSIPDLHDRLNADPPALVADIACGGGISSIALARAYPNVRVDGIDLDEASIALANTNLAGSGVESRVRFHHRDAADPVLAGRYDLVTVFEALHDMSRPVDVLRSIRSLLTDGGSAIVGDERTEDSFTAPAGDVERLYYGFSIMHCLPVGMTGDDPVGTGAVMRAHTVAQYGREAGFAEVERLPIQHDFWQFYRLRG